MKKPSVGKAKWIGRALSVMVSAPLVMSFAMKFAKGSQVMEGIAHLGWPETMVIPLGLLEMTSVVFYLIPQLSILGAILLTGYLGGAISTHLRIGEPAYIQFGLGVVAWLGLFLREERLRVLLPLRAKNFVYERQITINRAPADVFPYLKLLKNFRNWNPFLEKDPQTKTEYYGVDGQPGVGVRWDGGREVGAGEQEITKIVEGSRVEFELRFKRPFAATNQGYFSVEPAGQNQSIVRWGMSGPSPFPMNVISLLISCDKMVGRDFERGLGKLKAILEK